jgi:DNA ligase (NAD+)
LYVENARNVAAGSLNLKDESEFLSRPLTFIAYDIMPKQYKTWREELKELQTLGFHTAIDSSWDQFPQDGKVYRLDSNEEFTLKGYTAHHPRGAFAYKQQKAGKVAELLDVVWQVGKSGVVSPVGILSPVEIDGATVQKATLHNIEYIESLGLEIGCSVEVIRSGDIIPRVVRRVD